MKDIELITILQKYITEAQLKQAIVYRGLQPFLMATEIKLGREKKVAPFAGIMLFVDLMPSLNWAHPCLFLLVSEDLFQTKLVKSSFPPRGLKCSNKFKIIMQAKEEKDSSIS